MATLSIRMRDSLKPQALAKSQGVSLNNFINATIAAAVAQEEALAFFDDKLRNMDLETLHKRVLKFMQQEQPGDEPSPEDVRKAIGQR